MPTPLQFANTYPSRNHADLRARVAAACLHEKSCDMEGAGTRMNSAKSVLLLVGVPVPTTAPASPPVAGGRIAAPSITKDSSPVPCRS